ncbi:MAG: sugar ABC transporter permease [Rhodospirillales bacterium]|nr:sugar ABC transporter permease [Rhodospirillales bacterium]
MGIGNSTAGVRRDRLGPMGRREARLAYAMLLPTVFVVFLIVLFPVGANFWISAKPVQLGDLRAPQVFVKERIRGKVEPGQTITLDYSLRNSSQTRPIENVRLLDRIPEGLTLIDPDPRCSLTDGQLDCALGLWKPKQRDRLRIKATVSAVGDGTLPAPRETEATTTGDAANILTNLEFTFENYRAVFDDREFWEVLKVSLYYTIFGTGGALILGLFAAQLLNTAFAGRAILRGLFLFPYVAPVIAVAFTWVLFLDPFSGTLNHLLMGTGVSGDPINFLGQRSIELHFLGISFDFPMALTTVIVFEAWRYFPLAFLFILARLQALPGELYEAAEMDGATPIQQFWHITFPQLVGILSVLFLLRFIWTFNKFDDIFLLTGGAAGTRTLTVNVYEQGFALSNLGAGAAVAVVVFGVLAVFVACYFLFAPKEEGM